MSESAMNAMAEPEQLDLTVHHLEFTLEARTYIHLGLQAGAQLRGALWSALEQFACTSPQTQTPEHRLNCPMCRLVALETQEGARGINPPRPFVIHPPLPVEAGQECRFAPGETLTIGISLFGNAAEVFPYVAQAVRRMGEIGVGYGRGRFTITTIHAVNPLMGTSSVIYNGRDQVTLPDQPITHDAVRARAEHLPTNDLTLHFLTPIQLTQEKRVLNKPEFAVLIARLLERCQALETVYTDNAATVETWQTRYLTLTTLAAQVRLADCQTRWVKVLSGSRRTNRTSEISGLVGTARYTGDLTPFRYWLVWGSLLNVGKNAAKSNGWYRLEQ